MTKLKKGIIFTLLLIVNLVIIYINRPKDNLVIPYISFQESMMDIYDYIEMHPIYFKDQQQKETIGYSEISRAPYKDNENDILFTIYGFLDEDIWTNRPEYRFDNIAEETETWTKGDITVYLKENYEEDEIKVKFRYENGFYTIDILNDGYPEQEFYDFAEERLNRLFDTIE